MSTHSNNNHPKLHNAMWPGLVGKGSPGAEPFIDLDTMLDLTANAKVDGIKFDGIDIFLFDPHINIDIRDDALKKLADKIRTKGFVIGSVVAPVWPPTGGGSAMGSEEERAKFVGAVRKACRIAKTLRELGVRPYGIVRIDSASSPTDWYNEPDANQRKIAETFRQAADVAEDYGERLAAEGEICWGGMHSWRRMVQLLEMTDRPKTVGFQADMAHTLLYTLGYNAPEDAILPPGWDWSEPRELDAAMKALTAALRPWTVDFHVAQNDGTVKGSGTHDKTGHHCLPNDPNGKLQITHHAGYWLHGEDGRLTKAFRHICWDGCMFPNEVMLKQQTWNDILSAMIAVRDAHGWREDGVQQAMPAEVEEPITIRKAPKPPAKKPAKPAKKPAKKGAKTAAKRKVTKAARVKAAKKPVKKAKKLAAKKPARAKATKTAKKGKKGKKR